MIEKPWSHAGNGCFFYDADGKYIKGTGEANTFTTPANCTSIRFNYIVGKKINLAELKARCCWSKAIHCQLPMNHTEVYLTSLMY